MNQTVEKTGSGKVGHGKMYKNIHDDIVKAECDIHTAFEVTIGV